MPHGMALPGIPAAPADEARAGHKWKRWKGEMALCWVPQNHQFPSQHQEMAQKGVFSPQNAGHASLPGHIWALTLRLLSPGGRGDAGGDLGVAGGNSGNTVVRINSLY